MFLKGKNKGSDEFFNEQDSLDVVDLDSQKESDIEKLFKASSIDSSHPDKIIIRDVDRRYKTPWKDVEDDSEPEKKRKVRVKKPREKKRFSLSWLWDFDDEEDEEFEGTEYVPLASELDNKANSDFRKDSADWMDSDYKPDKSGLDDLTEKSGFGSKTVLIEFAVAALAVFLLIFGVLLASAKAKTKCIEHRKEAFTKLLTFEASEGDEVAKNVESIEAPISTGSKDSDRKSVLSLVLSSVEKDLKIKLVDEEDTLVRDVDWSVTVTDNDGESTDEEDDDRDGIIHMTDISAGDYTVELNPSSSLIDYELPASAQTVSVKAKIEYKVIANIKEEIKTEKEVNVAAEDVGNKPADVEQSAQLQDTVEWLESTKTATDGKYEEAEVDIKKTSKNTVGARMTAFLDTLKSTFRASFGKFTVAYPLILAEPETPETPPNSTEPTHEHVFDGAAASNENGTHTRICTVEGCTETKEDPCTYDAGNKCTVCGYIKPHEHSLKYEPNSNETHVIKCQNEGCTDYPKTKNCTYDSSGSCTCGNKKPEEKPPETPAEEHKLTYSPNNDGTHNITCSVPDCKEHNKAKVICEADTKTNKCKFCNATVIKHTYLYKPDNDGTHTAKCSESSCSVHPNIVGEACTFGLDNKCTKCGYENSELSKYADMAQLYDSNMNQLYVYEDGSYRLAKFLDYKKDKDRKFYRKLEDYLYTGWQTINGKRYYYNRDNEPVTGDQVIGGVQYHFGTDGALSEGSGKLGIDVSKYQPSINWSSVKKSGIDYVIIRCGYRGSDTGVLIEDPYFRSHIKGAKAAGLKVGVYFFTTAVSEAEAIEEASMVAYLCSNYGIDYPVFMDCESSPRAGYNGMSASQRTAIIKAFCNTVRSAGYTPGVYANKTWLSSYMNAGELGGYKIWLAQYNSAPTYTGRYDLWQYTSKGRVDGISGNVDMNQSYLGY